MNNIENGRALTEQENIDAVILILLSPYIYLLYWSLLLFNWYSDNGNFLQERKKLKIKKNFEFMEKIFL